MSLRIDLDFRHGLAEPKLMRDAEGRLALTVTRGIETVVLQLSLASLEALSLELMLGLARLKKG